MNLFDVADGILDSDFSKETLEDDSLVIDYARASGLDIDYVEAGFIISACNNWLENGNCQSDYYHMVEKPLS